LPVHGGDRDAAAARYGVDADSLVDLSANVNPLGPPPALLTALRDGAADAAALQRYPEPTYRALRRSIARTLAVDPESIVVGNGAAALLEAALALGQPRSCVVPVPAFSEYARALTAVGIEAVAVPLAADSDFALDPARFVDAVRRSGAKVAIVTNPHNPSGALTSRARMLELAAALELLGCRTIVDEAFIDYAPQESVTDVAARSENVICVRSLTKFFAVPALRVGYAVAAPDTARDLRARLPSWPVTTLAADAVAAALGDRDFAERSLRTNAVERARLLDGLTKVGLRVIPPAANFVLVELPARLSSAVVTERLAREFGILVRDCGSYDGLSGEWLRVAVRTRAESERFVAALGALLPSAVERSYT
jgi:threonine-phosphate decarboxylase